MRLLHISPHYGGGVGSVVSALCVELEACGVKNIVVSLDKPNSNPFHNLVINHVPCHLDASFSDTISGFIDQTDIIILHYWNHPLTSYFLSSYTFLRSKILLWFHTSGFHPLNPIPSHFFELPVTSIFSTSASWQLLTPSVRHRISNTLCIHSTCNLARFLASSRDRVYRNQPESLVYIGTISQQKLHPNSFNLFYG